MYINSEPMQPDTFSRYGYADAGTLFALQQGYGHDRYPQYPTAYEYPRVLSGLGAFTRNGFTVRYYAGPGKLSFGNTNVKRFYEALRNADIDFQKMCADVRTAITPALKGIEDFSGGRIKAAALTQALRLPLPTWGLALILEAAGGKRPLDQVFRAYMKQSAEEMKITAVLSGTVAALSASSAALLLVPGLNATITPAMPAIAKLGVIAGVVAPVAAGLGIAYNSVAEGKAPSGPQMKVLMSSASLVAGPLVGAPTVPTNAEAAQLADALGKALKAPTKAITDTASRAVDNFLKVVPPPVKEPSRPPRQPTTRKPKEKEPESSLPTAKNATALLVGLAALASVVIATR